MSSGSTATELKTIFDPETCVRKGLCPVTVLRKQTGDPLKSHSLYFELHGTGPEKVVFIIGYVIFVYQNIIKLPHNTSRLNTTSFSWESQVKHFARTGKHSVLVFDNRGVGNSDTPRGPYSCVFLSVQLCVRNFNEHVGQSGWRKMS